ncbi:hypothetical protein FOXYSP1_14276 [Fusarium oxysporum f. sp. phaseoli]
MLEAVGDLDDTGVWESITVSDPSSNTTVLLQATLYMTSFQAQGMEDNATRTTPRLTEPSADWDPLYAGTINSAQISIFSDVAMCTKSPAIALEAYFTRLCSICFDRIATFDIVGSSMQVSLVQATRQLGWSAFISVLVVVVTHLILVLLVILMSRLSGVPGRFQNVWASISQLLRSVTEDWIREADRVDDKTLELWLNDLGLHNVLLGIEYVQCRVYLVNKRKVS